MATPATRRMPPTRPIVSAFRFASAWLMSVRPNAAPAALKSPSRIAAMPTATRKPKNAAPRFRPPNSSRWRARTSRTRWRPVRPVALRSRTKRPSSVSLARVVTGRSAVATVPRSSSPSPAPPFLLNRSSMRYWYPVKGAGNPLWSSRRGALAPRRSGHERRVAARQARVLLVPPQERRSLEAGRLGVLALARRVSLLSAVRLAVEALDDAKRRGALVGVRRHVGVRALPRRTRRTPPERAAVDDRDLRQVMLLAAARRVAARAVARERRCADRDELGELPAREAQVGQDRVQLRHEHVRGLEHGLGSPQEARARGHAGPRRAHERVDVVEELLEVGRQVAEVAQRRGEVLRRLAQVAHERIGVAGEGLETLHRRARLAQEGREDLERLGERVV